jgi:hypothetical protein
MCHALLAPMRQYLSSLVIVMLGIACGGTTGTDDSGGAGSSAGGSASAGNNQGGSSAAGTASTAGKTSGGSSSGGSSSGGSISVGGFGGVIVTAGTSSGGISSGGTGVVNPDCPAHVPMGACSADDANVSCQYDPNTGCLCYPSAPGTFYPCQKVDPTCTYMAPAAAPPPAEGTGGFSAKVALPPHQVCRCTATMWTCSYGI